MRFQRFLSASFAVLAISIFALGAHAQQHLVLFESFTNTCDPCPDGLRPPFDDAVNSVLSSKRNKIIHFSEHIGNICDPCAQSAVGANPTDARLTGNPNGNIIDASAVDRKDFGGGRVSGTGTDWGSQIDQEAALPAVASIALDHVTLDKTSSGTYFIAHAFVKVTLNQSIPDNLKLYFAVLQDGVVLPSSDACSPEPTTQNDVVRYVTSSSPIPVLTGGGAAGASVIVNGSFNIHSPSSDALYDFSKMRLIAFVEESSNSSDYHVVNAANLRTDLDTLAPPPPTLVLDSSGLDDSTFFAGEQVGISYSGTFLVHGVRIFYSPDAGTNWEMIADSITDNYFLWTVPDTVTTQGKIKVVSVDNANLVSIQDGTFSIRFKPYIRFTHPATTKDTATQGVPYTISWTKYQVSTVSLQYQVAALVNPKWIWLVQNSTDTSFTWTPDTFAVVLVQAIPSGNEASAILDTLVVKRSFGRGVASSETSGFAIKDVYPNPVTGKEVFVRYSVPKPCDLTFEIIDLLGHQVYLDRVSVVEPGQYPLKTSGLLPGTYVIRISDGEHAASKRVEVTR
ncbi:MAG: T9SS type A sorting domain-containing protein [Bacteroidota bacterium]|nr:T9SS type A sorting domain-containing protein [Bacteroidota bacterium]MDP4232901.1 T9SS type A sorting domain-containing protein [Bacteroidota bacterium]MDP4241945.1 T9SS type A sorting domain-containing protein [Bacteroidota bacterium]MDP4286848.1 T9SS type A sorting domain-containing protein [Bacteroidota bacterium]